MEQFYCYLPLEDNINNLGEAINIISELCESKVFDDSHRYPMDTYRNFRITYEHEHIYLNTLLNKEFASDDRLFIRLRLNCQNEKLIDLLTQKAIKMKGYYGDNSKEFLDHDGNTVFNVKDGENYVIISYGELITRLKNSSLNFKERKLKELSKASLIELFEKEFKITLEPKESNQYAMSITPQKNTVTYNAE